jgi:glutamate carboxypeptidase
MSVLSATETRAIATIDQAAMLRQVEGWAQINTGSRNLTGLADMAARLATAFAALPGTVRLVDAAPVEAMRDDGSLAGVAHGQHLIVTVRPDAPVRLLLTGHMDTVFGVDHSFQTLRWLDADTLNGPGVADMKGGIAVMLHALLAVEASGGAGVIGYDVLINSDEEVGSLSSAPLIIDLAAGKAAALTYEPSALPDGTLAGARPGSGNFAIHITGKAAHAGRNPEDGRNALVAAADLAVRLKAAHRPDMTINPARIGGGGPNNIVPDNTVLHVNIRPRDAAALAEAQQLLADLTKAIALAHDVVIHMHGHFARPPKPLDPAAERLFALVTDAGRALGQTIGRKNSGGVCDGNNIAACGVPVVDTMGVRGGSIHSSDEYLITSSLSERAALSAVTILRIAQQGGV